MDSIRDGIRNDIAIVQAEMDAYFADAHPSVEQLRVPIADTLDTARALLGSQGNFLPFARMYLAQAEKMFAGAKEQLGRYGGPKNARLYPSRQPRVP